MCVCTVYVFTYSELSDVLKLFIVNIYIYIYIYIYVQFTFLLIVNLVMF